METEMDPALLQVYRAAFVWEEWGMCRGRRSKRLTRDDEAAAALKEEQEQLQQQQRGTGNRNMKRKRKVKHWDAPRRKKIVKREPGNAELGLDLVLDPDLSDSVEQGGATRRSTRITGAKAPNTFSIRSTRTSRSIRTRTMTRSDASSLTPIEDLEAGLEVGPVEEVKPRVGRLQLRNGSSNRGGAGGGGGGKGKQRESGEGSASLPIPMSDDDDDDDTSMQGGRMPHTSTPPPLSMDSMNTATSSSDLRTSGPFSSSPIPYRRSSQAHPAPFPVLHPPPLHVFCRPQQLPPRAEDMHSISQHGPNELHPSVNDNEWRLPTPASSSSSSSPPPSLQLQQPYFHFHSQPRISVPLSESADPFPPALQPFAGVLAAVGVGSLDDARRYVPPDKADEYVEMLKQTLPGAMREFSVTQIWALKNALAGNAR